MQLDVYISRVPGTVKTSEVYWFRPDGSEILDSDASFQNSRRTMVLSDVQRADAGLYKCEARIPVFGTTVLSESATIELEVYGEFNYCIITSSFP